jgi:hypothetical protein
MSKTVRWWLYLAWMAISMLAIPTLISAPSTLLFLIGVLWSISLVVISWKFWAHNLLKEFE